MAFIIKGTRRAMGTFVTIAAVHPGTDEAERAVQAAFDEIYRIQDLMSIHQAGSEASALNRDGCCEGASPDTRCVIQRASYFSEASGGAFDITVLPLVKLWEGRTRTGEAPSDAEIVRARELVDHRNVVIEDNNIRLNKPGAGVTLAGGAKGYAVDRAVAVLKKAGIRHALVNGGGDIRVIGGKTATTPWRIAVRDPRRRGHAITLELRDGAVATSGTYQRRDHDMINPGTGRPVRGLLSATVIADRAIDADILATCVYILGAAKGMEMLGKLDGVQALLITEDGNNLRFPTSGEITTAL